jgi:hypothetical protein
VYSTTGTTNDCGTVGLTGTLTLYDVGWMAANVSIPLDAPALGGHSGFVTMGDNNLDCGGPGTCEGVYDQEGQTAPLISELVEPSWVVGVARGMIPWVGAIKLLIENENTGEIPAQSWQFLGLSVAGLILLALGLHFALRREGIEDPRRRAAEEADEEDDRDEPEVGTSRTRRILRSLRPWGGPDEEGEEPDESEATPKGRPRPAPTSGRRGRPRPHVRRAASSKKRKKATTETDDEL